MKNTRVFIQLFLFAALLLFSAVPIFAVENWISVRSQNFNLVGNADETEIRRVAAKLEQFRAVFTQSFKELKFNSPIPTTVIVFKNEAALAAFKPLTADGQIKDWVKGFFQADTDVNYIVVSAAQSEDGDFTTVYHEYVHFLIANTLGKSNVPPWLNEGLAEYFEQLKFKNERQAVFGNSNKLHLSLLNKNGLLPLEKFFATDYYTLNRQSKDDVIHFYAQAWVLTHFLMHENKSFDLLTEISRNQQFAKQPITQKLNTDYAALDKSLKRYLEQKSFENKVFTLDKLIPVGEISNTFSLSASDEKAVLGDLLLRSNRSAEAAVLLEESLKLNPASSFANTTYGLLKLKENNFTEAKRFLEKAVANDARNYFAYFIYAYILSREGMTDFGFVGAYSNENALNIRKNLLKAIELNPSFAESYQLYSFVSVIKNDELNEALEMIEKALAIAPGNQMYNLRKAELLMRTHDFGEARKIAQKIIQTASEDKLKFYALNVLNQINAWEAQLNDIEEQKKRPRKNEAVHETPPTEEEIQKLNARAMLESLNQALRRPKPNEKRMLGFLTKIECEPQSVNFTVKSENQTFQLKNKTVADIFLTSFVADHSNKPFGCDSSQVGKFAVITYKPNSLLGKEYEGEISAIEFVPQTFVFLDVSKIVHRTEF